MEHLPFEVIDSLARSKPGPIMMLVVGLISFGFLLHFA